MAVAILHLCQSVVQCAEYHLKYLEVVVEVEQLLGFAALAVDVPVAITVADKAAVVEVPVAVDAVQVAVIVVAEVAVVEFAAEVADAASQVDPTDVAKVHYSVASCL